MKNAITFLFILTANWVIAQSSYTTINLPSQFTSAEIRMRTGLAGDSYGNVWVAFQYKGLARYNNGGWQLFNTTNSPLLSDTILCLYSYNNYIYIGTPRGLSCFNSFTWTNYTTQDGLPGNEVYGIYCDSQGLIITTQKHLSVRNGNNWTHVQIPNTDFTGRYYSGVYTYYHSPVLRDIAGNIWVGRYDAGLQKRNGNSWQSVTYNNMPIQAYALETDTNGRIWIGRGAQTCVYDGTAVKTLHELQYIDIDFATGLIISFTRTPSGGLFFGNNYRQYLFTDRLYVSETHLPITSTMHTCYSDNCYYMLHQSSDNALLYRINYLPALFYGGMYSQNSYKDLDGNMVKARYGTRGMLFWDGIGNPCYEVPRGSGKHSLFASGLWLGGRDAGNNLHVAMQKYRQGGDDLYSGPVRSYGPGAGTTDTLACIPYDRIWKINKWEIDSFRSWYNNGTLGTGTHTIPEVIASWPAHGDTAEGFDFYLAPFVDTDGDGVYRPALGDYPLIRGTQMLWWVYNDVLGPHTESGGLPLGVEVRASAYIYGCDTFSGTTNAINYTTFLHYEIINRSANTYHDCFAGIWTDADLGDHADDYTGCNVGQNSFYFYNGDNQDGDGNGKTYGTNPPAISTAILNGPWAPLNDGIDNDKDGITDEPFESTGMSSFMYFNNSGAATGDPQTAEECLYYMQGRWRDGSHMTYGGTGYNSSSVECQFMFPGRPTTDPYGWGTGGVPMGDWSEESENNSPADRRGIAGMGPFNWAPGEIHYIDLAFVWSRAFTGQAWASVEKNFVETAQIIDWYHNGGPQPWLYGGNFPYCDIQPMSVTQPMVAGDKMRLYPNPASDNVFVLLPAGSGNCRLEITNTNGQIADCKTVSGKTEFNVSNYPPGIYFVRAVGESYTGSVKMVVQ